MQPLIKISAIVMLAVACSRGVESNEVASAGDAGPDALGDAAVDARPEVALRADGCPVSGASSNFFDYCPKGKVCEYPEECTPLNVKYTIQRCQTDKDYTTSWNRTLADCSLLTGPDGCPLGHATNRTCTELGKTCVYRRCTGTEGNISTFVCKPFDGGMMFGPEPIVKCGADSGT